MTARPPAKARITRRVRSVQQLLHIICIGVGIAWLADGGGGGDNRVAVNGSGNDHALAHGSGSGVERHVRVYLAVEHEDIALSPYEIEFLGTCHARDFGATVTCGVDDTLRPETSGARLDLEPIIFRRDLRDLVTA